MKKQFLPLLTISFLFSARVGVFYNTRYWSWNQFTSSDFQQFRDDGIPNIITFEKWAILEPQKGNLDPYSTLLTYAQKYGIRVVLYIHVQFWYPLGQFTVPIWLTNLEPYAAQCSNILIQPGPRAHLTNTYDHLIAHTKDNPNVIGYSIMDEPGNHETPWASSRLELSSQMRSIFNAHNISSGQNKKLLTYFCTRHDYGQWNGQDNWSNGAAEIVDVIANNYLRTNFLLYYQERYAKPQWTAVNEKWSTNSEEGGYGEPDKYSKTYSYLYEQTVKGGVETVFWYAWSSDQYSELNNIFDVSNKQCGLVYRALCDFGRGVDSFEAVIPSSNLWSPISYISMVSNLTSPVDQSICVGKIQLPSSKALTRKKIVGKNWIDNRPLISGTNVLYATLMGWIYSPSHPLHLTFRLNGYGTINWLYNYTIPKTSSWQLFEFPLTKDAPGFFWLSEAQGILCEPDLSTISSFSISNRSETAVEFFLDQIRVVDSEIKNHADISTILTDNITLKVNPGHGNLYTLFHDDNLNFLYFSADYKLTWVQILITDINGRLVQKLFFKNISEGEKKLLLHTAQVPQGIYIFSVRVHNPDTSKTLNNHTATYFKLINF
jgi:hypothetical protein